jgi:hypothetical protein
MGYTKRGQKWVFSMTIRARVSQLLRRKLLGFIMRFGMQKAGETEVLKLRIVKNSFNLTQKVN